MSQARPTSSCLWTVVGSAADHRAIVGHTRARLNDRSCGRRLAGVSVQAADRRSAMGVRRAALSPPTVDEACLRRTVAELVNGKAESPSYPPCHVGYEPTQISRQIPARAACPCAGGGVGSAQQHCSGRSDRPPRWDEAGPRPDQPQRGPGGSATRVFRTWLG